MGAVLSAVGSAVLLSDQIVSLNAAGIGLRALPIALLGGMESVRGALLAGAIIGVGEALASVYVDPFTKGVSSQLCDHDRRSVVPSARPLRLESHREAVRRHAAPDR